MCMALFVWFWESKLEVYAQDGKVIAIIYDDSSSMAFDYVNKKVGNFRTKWSEADYAVRAFVECKNPEDEVALFAMNKVDKENPNPIIIPANSEDDEDGDKKIEEAIDEMSETFYDNTPYESVTTALGWLKSNPKDAEKWLIILTDGEFYENKEKISKEDLLLKLEASLGGDGGTCTILYVPLDEGGELAENQGQEEEQIRQIKNKDGIRERILMASNEIYRREQLDIIGTKDGKELNIDVPLSELIVIKQKEGKEYTYKDKSTKNNGDGSDSTQNNNEENIEDNFSELRDKLNDTGEYNYQQNYFKSYGGTIPSYEGNETSNAYFQENLLAKDIIGTMACFQWENCDISEGRELKFELKPEENESIVLYYQLKFDLEIEVIQDGEVVKEDEIKEGEFEVSIYPVTCGEDRKRVSTDASLLKLNDVKFFLNGEIYILGQPKKMEAGLGERIKLVAKAEGKAIGESITAEKELNVVEKIYPINIRVTEKPDNFNYDTLVQNRTEKADGIKIDLTENMEMEETQLRDTTKNNLVVEAEVSYKGLKEKEEPAIQVKIEYGESKDEWYLYPYLVNENDFNKYEDVKCTITVYRKDQPELSHKDEVIDMPLVASPIELKVLAPEDTYSIWDIICKKIRPQIYRNGNELPEEQWRNIKYTAMEGDASKHIIGSKGIIFRPLEILYWFFYGKDEIFVCKEVRYVERGMEYIAVLEGMLSFQPVSGWIRGSVIGLMILVGLLVLWVIGRVLSGKCFVWGFRAYMCLIAPEWQVFEEEKIRPKRMWRQILLPGKPLRFVLSNNDDREQEDFPDMYIRKDKKENKFIIMNGTDFEKKNFRAGDIKIVDRIYMDPEDCIKIVDSAGIHYELYFKAKEKGEE